jgi:sRNA-binding carbon storage regulator CsrA
MMLALTRKPGEWIDLVLPNGQKVAMQLVRSGASQATIGFEAPDNVIIMRREMAENYGPSAKRRQLSGGAI